MLKLFLLFFCVGILSAWRRRNTMRLYNRKMFPSMQQAHDFAIPLFLFTLLGVAAAACAWLIQSYK